MRLVLPRPRQTNAIGHARRLWLFTSYGVGCASVATATGYPGYLPRPVPHAVQVPLGVLIVFVVPGLSLVWAALPDHQSLTERLLVAVGISVIVATCAAVLLAATPIGLSRHALAELLGGIAIVLSLGGLHRSRAAAAVREIRARTKKRSISEPRGRGRPGNSAKSRQDTENESRSVIVLRFPFDGDSAGHRH
jgi:Protein of unknown function (DUF1616)